MLSQDAVDIAKYAMVEYDDENMILKWEEMRDIFYVVIKYSDGSQIGEPKLQYWHRNWPHHRVPKGKPVGGGSFGWMRDDDWFNGEWIDADANVQIRDGKAIFSFNPVNSKEFPDVGDFDAKYRRTLKIRIPKAGVESVEVYTDSVWRDSEVRIQWGDGFGQENLKFQLTVYNGELTDVKYGTRTVLAKVRYMYNEDFNSYDKTIITVHNDPKSFSFLMNDVLSGERIFIKDYDVLITKSEDEVDFETFKKEWEAKHNKTIYDMVSELPEQTYDKSWNDMPKKKGRGFMPLGCEGGRQKFGVDQNGDVFSPKNFIAKVRGKDTDRLLWEGNWMRYSFGFPSVEPVERYIEDGYIPMIHAKWISDNVSYEQSAFATPLGQDILSGKRIQGDDPVILLVKVTLKNVDEGARNVCLTLKARCDVEETLREKDGFVFAINYEPNRMRFFIDTKGRGGLQADRNALLYTVKLLPGESHSVYFKIPFITLDQKDEFQLVKEVDYENEFPRVKQFWKERVAEGTQIETPNRILNNYYKAHLTHMLITDDREPGSDRYASRVGTFPYGIFANESMMCISDLDRRGYKKEAEERLEMLIHYQGTVPLPGMYSSYEGVYYGANGYECGGYNQHHGWTLWAIGEHYWYHKDRDWLKRVAPSVVKACEWIINERQATRKFDSEGKKVIEYGFLPPGSLEDVTDFWHWLSTNAYTYWGFKNAALALVDIGHPEGERLLKEAEEYGDDLRRGFTQSRILSPVVKLRDGTYIPHFPPRLYLRGRGLGWIRETLEGAIHLIRTGILDPCSQESTWIMKDYEDNLYISEKYGYTVEDFDRDWFSLGGFSMQSNLLCSPMPYLFRDEPKHFLRSYFNAFTSVFYPDICACVEHALPTLADNNGVWFKPSDEAQSTYWLRLMFIYEQGNKLNLGMMLPREWFKDGNTISIRNASTYFGNMGFEIISRSDSIIMVLDPPTRDLPDEINVRFRHPHCRPMRRVIVNDKEWTDFLPEKELIKLGKTDKVTKIIALY